MSSNRCSSICKFTENSCNTNIKFHKLKYVWTIEDFDFHEARGSVLYSPTFSAITNDEVKWYLQLAPNGETDAKDTIAHSVFLSCDSTYDGKHGKVFMKYSVAALDRHHKEIECLRDIGKDEICDFDLSVPSNELDKHGWGESESFVKTADFRNNVLSNNKLTIICTMIFSYVRDALTNTVRCCTPAKLYPNPVCNLVENFGKLLESHEFADVILSVKNKEYPAHKNILAARSSVFAAMFRHNLKENETNLIEIDDMDEEVTAEMLRYIYTGKCENCEKLADGLLVAADKYHLDGLKMISAEALYKTLSVDNAANIFASADSHCVLELKYETVKFIVARFAEVVVSTAWKDLLVLRPDLINEACQAVGDRLIALN